MWCAVRVGVRKVYYVVIFIGSVAWCAEGLLRCDIHWECCVLCMEITLVGLCL